VHSNSLASSRAEPSPLHPGDVVTVAPSTSAPLRRLRSWKFVTHHAHVLLVVANEPEVRVQEIARMVEITERSAYRILSDLVEAGYLTRRRVGRHNRYHLNMELPLGDPMVGAHTVRELLRALERTRA
jgi:DNA-binding transcriptional ArsR family regulator